MAGRVDVAWNSPLAWVRVRRMAAARGVTLTQVTMRDTDRDLRSVVAVRADSPRPLARRPARADRRHRRRRLAAGHAAAAVAAARRGPAPAGPDGDGDVAVRRFDIGVGLHGDHIGGERDAARALFGADPGGRGLRDRLEPAAVRPGGRPAVRLGPGPRADAAVRPLHDDRGAVRRRHADASASASCCSAWTTPTPDLRPLLDLEGLKQWLPPRLDGYAQLGARRRRGRLLRRRRARRSVPRRLPTLTRLGLRSTAGHLLRRPRARPRLRARAAG